MGDSLDLERAVRREIRKVWYRREEDFSELEAYNDYLEEVEELVMLMLDDKTKAEAQARLKTLSRTDRELTARNRSKLDDEKRRLLEAAEAERQGAAVRAEERRRAESAQAEAQARVKAELQDDIALGKATALEATERLTHAQAAGASEPKAEVSGYTYMPSEQQQQQQVLAQPLVKVEGAGQPKYMVPSAELKREAYEEDPVLLASICAAGGHTKDGWRKRYAQEAFDLSGLLITKG